MKDLANFLAKYGGGYTRKEMKIPGSLRYLHGRAKVEPRKLTKAQIAKAQRASKLFDVHDLLHNAEDYAYDARGMKSCQRAIAAIDKARADLLKARQLLNGIIAMDGKETV